MIKYLGVFGVADYEFGLTFSKFPPLSPWRVVMGDAKGLKF